MDEMLVAMYKSVLNKKNKVLRENLSRSFKLLGRYCPPSSYESLVMSAIKNDLAAWYPYTQAGSLKAFGLLFHGAIELLPEAKYLDKVQPLLANFVSTVTDYVLDGLDLELGEILIETLDEVIQSLLTKQRKGLDVKFLLEPHMDDIFKMIFRASSVFQSFKLQSKAEPENIKASKALIS